MTPPQQQQYIRVASDLKYTPTVRALFLTLAEPYFYSATDEKGSYSVTLTLDPEKDACLLYTSPSPRDLSTSRMPSSA